MTRSIPPIVRAKQSGWAVFSMLIATVVGMGALAAMMQAGTTSTRPQSIYNASSQLVAQASIIRAQVMSCAVGDVATGRTGDNGTGQNISFPYVGSAAGTRAGGAPLGTVGAVSTLYCPRTLSGASWVVGASDQHLWAGMNGVFLPQPPTGFGAWQFTNSASIVKISISYAGTNAEAAAAIAQAATKFGTAEVSTATANTLVVCLIVTSGACV